MAAPDRKRTSRDNRRLNAVIMIAGSLPAKD
jgi:hypothetical protein